MTALRIHLTDGAGVATEVPDLREIVHSHGRFVWRLLRYLGVANRDLDDVCQDVFATVHRKLEDLSDENVRSWLHTICINHAKNYRRRARHHREVLVDETPEQHVSAPQEESIELAEAQRRLLALLEGLDEDRRAVFVLHAIEEIPMERVSKIVGCPLSTAYHRFQRARAELEQKLVNP